MSESEQKLPDIEKVKTYLNNLNKKILIGGVCLFVLLCFWFLSDEDENAILIENSTQMLKMQQTNLKMQEALLIELKKLNVSNLKLLPPSSRQSAEIQMDKLNKYEGRNKRLKPDGYGT